MLVDATVQLIGISLLENILETVPVDSFSFKILSVKYRTLSYLFGGAPYADRVKNTSARAYIWSVSPCITFSF